MEIKVIVKEIKDSEIIVETDIKEIVSLPKRLLPQASLGQEIFLSLDDEAARRPRELLNEIFKP